METEAFFEEPYSNRQLITFVPDKAIIASKVTTKPSESNPPIENKKKSGFWAKVAKIAVAPINASLTRLFYAKAMKIIKSTIEAKKQGVENLRPIEKSKVPLFQLPLGHPRYRIVYAGHPAKPKMYVPLADFHRLTFEHKFSEVIDLLMNLGATTIKVEHVTGWGTDFSSRLNIVLPSVIPLTDIGAEAKAIQKNQQTLLYEAELENPQTPRLPDDLVWYPFESTWQQVANGRLKFGLKNFNLSLSYNDDYGINADIKLKIDKAGLNAGGVFEKYTATTWHIHGHF